ncbi:MAG: hypothetical protein LUC30_03845 [Clostridiales bacterium]|nr:hypothetical protein [Clostridiales bacterium]
MKKSKRFLCSLLFILMCMLASCGRGIVTESVLETEYPADTVTEGTDAAIGSYQAIWNDITIGQGERAVLTAEKNDCFQIGRGSQSVTVSISVTFDRAAPATVELGYLDLSASNTEPVEVLCASGGAVIQETFHISDVVAYEFYIYNGSSDPITISAMTVSVTQGEGET